MNKTKINLIMITIILAIIIAAIAWAVFLKEKPLPTETISWDGPGGHYEIEKIKNGNFTEYITYVELNNKKIGYNLRYSPEDLKNIYAEKNIQYYATQTSGWVFITRDLDIDNKTAQKSTVATLEVGEILGRGQFGLYGLKLKSARTKSTTETIPEITCKNVTVHNKVVYLKLGDENKVYQDSGCVIIQGKDGDGLIKAAEKFAYILLGVF